MIVHYGTNMQIQLILSHPDYNRRLQIYTGSADLYHQNDKALAGFMRVACYRRWGLSPRPEINAINITPIIQLRNGVFQNWRASHTFGQKT